MPKETKHPITIELKKKICQYHNEHPNVKHKELAIIFKIENSRSTITKILANKEKWLKEDTFGDAGQRVRIRVEKYHKTNEALSLWVTAAMENRLILSGAILQNKALTFAMNFDDEKDFKASEGWLEAFKKRHGIRSYILHGESNSAPLDNLPEARSMLQDIISQYDLDDVYNADETGIFYRLLPNRTLSTTQTSGTKKNKEQITILLACNSTGSHKIKPLVIGKAARPMTLRSLNMNNLLVTYQSNAKAWMTSEIFNKWLKTLNTQMVNRNKRILLLIDNASCHGKDHNLSNVTVKYFPPNMTSHLQPLDAGIIAACKAWYRRFHLSHLVDQYDGKIEMAKVSIKDAIYFLADSWNQITPETIHNCWTHVGIVDAELPLLPSNINVESDIHTDITYLINQLDIDPEIRMSTEQFLEMDSAVASHETMSDVEIVEEVLRRFNPLPPEIDSEDEITPLPMTAMQGKEMLEGALLWCEQQDEAEVNAEFLKKLRQLTRKATLKVAQQKKQQNISFFFDNKSE
jgi:hypothetical protein